MLEAEIHLLYDSPKVARTVRLSILPDNEPMSGKMRILTRLAGSKLKIHVGSCSRIETLQATIQDLFRCIHAAEGSFSVTKRKGRKL
ncbi:MAG TPA: KEOPS complex subunit Pcc1 [Candidatus Acidoferrum sp.]|nr:KEOPS complex subunit Pcc1 [Candidatus Acidoferrum sp.]